MTRLILVRHGQSLANQEEIFAGHSDFDLSELGHRQAALSADYLLANEHVDAIYSSDLLRAYHTATPIAERFGLPIVRDTGLREIYAGKWEGLRVSEIDRTYPEDFRRWREEFATVRCTGGESIPEVYGRIVPHICALAERHDGQCILLATHATVVRSFEAFANGYGATETDRVPFAGNASINIYEYENKKARSIAPNLDAHLGALASPVPKRLQA